MTNNNNNNIVKVLIAISLTLIALTLATVSASSFYIEGNSFLKDGESFQIISGSFHYFRSHPLLWRDRLQKMKAAGLNTVQTYIAWNVHQSIDMQFDFTTYNITQFFEIAQEEGLLVVVRAGPYICGEWEYGGFPAFIDQTVAIRSSDPAYLTYVTQYFNVLLPMLNEQLYTNGGPIIMVQVENEYGSYGSDKLYLNTLLSLYEKYFGTARGQESGVVFYSTDGSGDLYLYGSQIAGVYQTIDFGPTDDPESNFKIQRKFEPTGPLMNSEYYTGWLTHWLDSSPAGADTKSVADGLSAILKLGASVNMYMFYGGSNFGFMNGANSGGANDYEITIQSYDYDSPLNEAGDITNKYLAIRQVISEATGGKVGPIPANNTHIAYGTVEFTEAASLFSNLNIAQNVIANSGKPLTFSEAGLDYGFILYETTINTVYQSNQLDAMAVNDRATFYVNDIYQGFLQRTFNSSIKVEFQDGDTNTIRILLENQGRINYGSYMDDQKGLGDGVISYFQYLGPWNNYLLPLRSLDGLEYTPLSQYRNSSQPTFYRGYLNIASASDIGETYLSFEGLGKGNLWVNGFDVGRYWNVGPQYTMYIPSVLLQVGQNEIVIFETLLQKPVQSIQLIDQPFFN
ncbi:glycoside hydrolase family 35 protein [Heterostelium album PN500]|uniref:Beta-galactosidase n=1 Tax=Heterostelium pallidum (strain ATCC 26659 / Pp 5 / PN500) TaxID=670386 RepID=D3B7Y7_HETP5|nr:glycoside hydrolase family 35 protein [Heterostelium album PN500]EFA82155.1 glycoside hydrolase family 35 protein [Heterostelium album PN500]|eukprot:XP_020434272.1 glycoside hydrolase family 35 protein [Heterostelium album PN500]